MENAKIVRKTSPWKDWQPTLAQKIALIAKLKKVGDFLFFPKISRKILVNVFFFLILIDQLSKNWIVWQKLNFHCNPGFAFGITFKPAFVGFFLVFLAFLSYYIFIDRKKIHLEQEIEAGLVLILSGGISNLIDRFRWGCVIDFIDLRFWPVFNLADIFITLGTLFLIGSFFYKKEALTI